MFDELWSFSIVLMLLGVAAAGCSLWFQYLGNRKEPYHGHAEARVVEIAVVPREGKDSFSEYHNRLAAVFEFYADGRPVKVTDDSAVYPCPYHLNDRVQICYDPEDPQRYRIIRKNHWSGAAGRCRTLAVLCLLGGCSLFLLYAGRNAGKSLA